MLAISQLQFPPIKKLQALAAATGSKPDLEVFEFLQQLSHPWYELRLECLKWSESKRQKAVHLVNKSLGGDVSALKDSLAVDMISVEDKNNTRFFELACAWIRRHRKGYFPKLLEVAESISRIELPEPESTTLSLRLPAPFWSEENGRILEHGIQVRSWPHHKVFIAQQIGRFDESETLDYIHLGSDYDDLQDHLVAVQRVIWGARKKFKDYVGFFRKPFEGENGKYSETWVSLGETLPEEPMWGHTGAAVLDLLVRLADRDSRKAISDLQKFLTEIPGASERAALFDWACAEDGRVVF
jgi:hypothetical protein